MSEIVKPKTSFWIIAVAALVWNAIGCFQYLMMQLFSEEIMMNLPEAERELMANIPSWVTSAFAIAVWGGLLGTVLLLLRKKLAKTLFIVSFLALLVQLYYQFIVIDSMAVYGPNGLIMPIMIVAIAIFLIWYSNKCVKEGILK